MNVIIASDHRGFAIKKQIVAAPDLSDITFIDVGADTFLEGDNYTDYAKRAVEEMRSQGCELGILLCGSGVGMCIAANKFNGIRCGLGISSEQISAARNDDNINVLAIAAEYSTIEVAAEMVRSFVDTEFNSQPRYLERLSDIEQFESDEIHNGTNN